MPVYIGLDFGTTNTAAALFDGSYIQYIPLQSNYYNPIVMPSVLFLGRQGEFLIGQEAIDYYSAKNIGRQVSYEQRFFGRLTMHFAGTSRTEGRSVELVQNLYTNIDANTPGRLFQSLKLALADESFHSTDVYGTPWTLEQLIAALLREVRLRVEAFTGKPLAGVVLGRPVHYGSTEEQDIWALERMTRACDQAELPVADFMLEPVAAAYAYGLQIEKRCRALVFDFGGGTLDITIIDLNPAGTHEVLAVDGVTIGGDLLDSRIVTGALAPYFGQGATLGADRLPLPAFLTESLKSWQHIVELSTPRSLQIIEEAINTSDRPAELKALRSLVRENYGFQLYRQVEQAKCRLSQDQQTTIAMDVSDIHFSHELTRREFEMLIASESRQVRLCIDRALKTCSLDAGQIDVVLLTGGSSRIPRFVRLLAERFGNQRLREQDAFTSIVAGLAIAAAAQP